MNQVTFVLLGCQVVLRRLWDFWFHGGTISAYRYSWTYLGDIRLMVQTQSYRTPSDFECLTQAPTTAVDYF